MDIPEKTVSGELELDFVNEYGQSHGIVSLFNPNSTEIPLYKEWKDFIGEKVRITIQIVAEDNMHQ